MSSGGIHFSLYLSSTCEPKRGQTVDALGLAAKLWKEVGNDKKAAAVGQLAEKLGASPKAERSQANEGLQRLKQLEDEVAKLKAALDQKLGQLKELERKLDR